MSNFKTKRLPHNIRAQFRSHLVMQVEAECNILQAAGAPKREVQPFVNQALRTGSPLVFNHIADYAQAMMPKLLLNKPNWPPIYQSGDLVTQAPTALRELAKSFLDIFIDEFYANQPADEHLKTDKNPSSSKPAGV